MQLLFVFKNNMNITDLLYKAIDLYRYNNIEEVIKILTLILNTLQKEQEKQ